MNRTPDKATQKILRKENGFKCAIPECEIPYLEYHHFDPPWAENNHHTPDGMISLCPIHHRQADNGAWTIKQLHSFKSNAKQNFDKVKGKFNYLRNDFLLIAGGNFYFNNLRAEIMLSGHPLIWFEKDENNYKLLNIQLFDKSGNIYFNIKNNIWVVRNNIADVECPPNGRKLSIYFKNRNKISLEFIEIKTSDKLKRVIGENSSNFECIISLLPITAIKTTLKLIEFNVDFQSNKTNVGGITITDCLMLRNGVGMSF